VATVEAFNSVGAGWCPQLKRDSLGRNKNLYSEGLCPRMCGVCQQNCRLLAWLSS